VLLSNYPEPFADQTNVPFKTGKGTEVIFSVYDVLGREVIENKRVKMPSGGYELSLGFPGAAGVYFLVARFKTRQGWVVRREKLIDFDKYPQGMYGFGKRSLESMAEVYALHPGEPRGKGR